MRVRRRARKLAQFATSLLANHKFWLVPPLREKAASAVQPDIERKRNVVKGLDSSRYWALARCLGVRRLVYVLVAGFSSFE